MRKIEPTLESGSEMGLREEVRGLSSNAPGENIRKNKQNPSKPAIIVLRIQNKKIHTYIWKRKEWVVLGQTLAKPDLLLPVYKSRLTLMIFLVKSQKSNIILQSFLQSHSSDSLSFSSR